MMRCTIELIPGGVESHPRRRTIGVIDVANIGGDELSGNYTFTLDKSLFNRPGEVWKAGAVKGFPRKLRGPYDLLYRCLRNAVGKRNPA